MNELGEGPRPDSMEAFLSSAYRRILRLSTVLGISAALAAAALFHWQSAAGVALGASLSLLNFVWLHHGTEMLVRHWADPKGAAPSKFRLTIAFVGRYGFVMLSAYVILRGYSRMLEGFIVGLALPILAAMAEGVYEAVVTGRNDQTSN